MAIGFRASSAFAAGTTSVVGTIPTGTVAGDIMLLHVNCKPFSATIVTPAGWEIVAGSNGANGAVASGIDTGSVQWTTFWRLWQTGDGNVTVTITSGNVALACIKSFSKNSANIWVTPTGAKGSDTTSGTPFSITMDVDPGITTGDMIAGSTVLAGNDSNFGAPGITAASATIGTVTESPGEGATASGDDLESISFYALCTAGTATAPAVVTSTLSVAQTGGGNITRLRETLAGKGYFKNQAVNRAATF